jgi:hypothetical protein
VRLVHAKLARSIWLFDIRDLNPKGKDILGDLVSWIKEAYDFAVAPDPDNPVPNGAPSMPAATPQKVSDTVPGLVFHRGSFEAEKEVYISIHSLTIYDDGIVVDAASSTEDGDRFAADLLNRATQDFALAYDGDTVRRRIYLSELIVRSDMDLALLNPVLSRFADRISESSHTLPRVVPFVPGGISFWSEADDAGKQRAFRIERQAGRALSENRYFSDAPMQTKSHFAALEEFECLVMGTVPTLSA